MIWAGGVTLRRGGVARPHVVAWLVSLPTIPIATLLSSIVPVNVVGRPEAHAAFWTLIVGGILVVAGVLGAGAWWLGALASGGRRQ